MTMSVKEYLSQAYRIDQRINSKLEQVASLRELAKKATTALSDMPRNPNKNIHSMEGIIVKIIDLENDINRDIDDLIDLKREIVTTIKRIENPVHQTLLELRYLGFKGWEHIAVEMGYSLQHIFRIHDKALKTVVVQND